MQRPGGKPCPHNRQGILDGKLVCIRCGLPLASQGVVQDRVSPDGTRIILDPNPPIPRAGEGTREASSRNPASLRFKSRTRRTRTAQTR